MHTIKIFNQISEKGLTAFEPTKYQFGDSAPDAILLRSHKLSETEISSEVKAIGRAGAGTNNIPIDFANKKGIVVFNTPGANANAVKELVLAGMLLASRHLCKAWQTVNNMDASEQFSSEIENQKKNFKGFELPGKKLGVIGLGAIGVKVANCARDLGMEVIGFDPKLSVKRAWELSSDVKQAPSLEYLLKECQFISIHVPLSGATKHLLNAQKLDLLSNNTILLNFSRDALVDEDALLEQLAQNPKQCYVTDFPTVQLQNHPQVICLPHLGASTHEAEDNCAKMVCKQVKKFLDEGVITNSVNFPALDVAKNTEAYRLSISNSNVPNMVAQISTLIGQHNLNIIDFYNCSREELAYNLIDVDAPIPDALVDAISDVEGILNVRKIS